MLGALTDFVSSPRGKWVTLLVWVVVAGALLSQLPRLDEVRENEEALFLPRFASPVHVIHRRDELRASRIMAARAKKNQKIRFVWDSVVEEVLGDDDGVTGLRLSNVRSGETSELAVGALFIAIGHVPNTSPAET